MREKTANFPLTKPTRFPRPGYVTFLGVLTLILSVLDVALWYILTFNVLPILPVAPWFRIFLLIHAVLFALSGTFMLRGANWARLLYYFASLPAFIVAAVYGATLNPIAIGSYIFGFFVLLACYVGLSQPGANRYFAGRSRFLKGRGSDRDDVTGKAHTGHYDY